MKVLIILGTKPFLRNKRKLKLLNQLINKFNTHISRCEVSKQPTHDTFLDM